MTTVPDEHLTRGEVDRILDFIEDCNPIVVGGQATNIWAYHYAERDPDMVKRIGPFTSEDIDFFANKAATQKLAASLTESEILVPGMDDATPNAAVVIGKLGDRKIRVDFLASVLGVESGSITDDYIGLTGRDTNTGAPKTILLMNPSDCVRSRLANINILRRHDNVSIRQAQASIITLGHFIDELIGDGDIKVAQKTLHSYEKLITRSHAGRKSHLQHGRDLDVLAVPRRFIDDARLDPRWRELILNRAINRLSLKLEQRAAKHIENELRKKAPSLKKNEKGGL